MNWKKHTITLENGTIADAQHPVIVSASRSTDIPAFFADWFFYRLDVGYSAWTNPFNGVKSYVAYDETRFIVFWSKNPKPLLQHLDKLEKRGIGCYVQFSLNDYVDEGLERGVPSVDSRIETFKALVERLGKSHVIWRFDPLILTDRIGIDDIARKIEYIGNKLYGYTEKLVFSFVDISSYRKVKSNLDNAGIHYIEWSTSTMEELAFRLSTMNKNWGYALATCGERIDISKYGIQHNRCVDDDLIIRLAWRDTALMDFLGVRILENSGLFGAPDGAIDLGDGRYAIKTRNNRDKGQRELCGCIASKDIGEYNTCAHLCEYCYANASKECAMANLKRHRANPFAETITGI